MRAQSMCPLPIPMSEYYPNLLPICFFHLMVVVDIFYLGSQA